MASIYHDYYKASRQELREGSKIPLTILPKDADVFKALAEEMLREIREKNTQNKDCVIICPVGPVGHYPYFVEAVNREKLSLRQVWFINMDEYLDSEGKWIEADDPLSFRRHMEREVYGRIEPSLLPPPTQRLFPDPENIGAIPAAIEKLGGVDLVIGGIGINGHVAFNEPEPDMAVADFLNLKTRVLPIAQETRAANCIGGMNGALEDMPSLCATVGMWEIFQAKRIRLGAFRDWHRGVVRRACLGAESTEFPVSLMQSHPDCEILIHDFVADLPA